MQRCYEVAKRRRARGTGACISALERALAEESESGYHGRDRSQSSRLLGQIRGRSAPFVSRLGFCRYFQSPVAEGVESGRMEPLKMRRALTSPRATCVRDRWCRPFGPWPDSAPSCKNRRQMKLDLPRRGRWNGAASVAGHVHRDTPVTRSGRTDLASNGKGAGIARQMRQTVKDVHHRDGEGTDPRYLSLDCMLQECTCSLIPDGGWRPLRPALGLVGPVGWDGQPILRVHRRSRMSAREFAHSYDQRYMPAWSPTRAVHCQGPSRGGSQGRWQIDRPKQTRAL